MSFNELEKILDSKPRKRAIVYCRVSTDKQEQDGESLEYQEEKCRQYAELHNLDVVLVLREAKSGYIHYSFREQLTLARKFIRDGMADIIIVWDLRRFSRNFVHSAMIFEEIESVGAEIVSVSENIDNSLTGKLIRSILAWSAESEREKILEYANRHWQTRLAEGLPVGSGRVPYGWEWGNREKTFYVVNPEEAAVRFSIFHMFVNLDMSLRGIAHKLTEDGILPPAKSRGARVKSFAWQPSTVYMMLHDVANIGVLRICKTTRVMTEKGKVTVKPNVNVKVIEGGLPALVPVELYELAQMKLRTNRADKSHVHSNPEDFLLKRHIFCKTCNYAMCGKYQTSRQTHTYAYYICPNHRNKYEACPDLITIRSDNINQIVWEDCCRVFERLDLIRETIEQGIEQSLQGVLEDTKGAMLISQLAEEIAFAKAERAKHSESSYYYNLISQDIREKEARLSKYEAEHKKSHDIVKLSNIYQRSILGFLDFLQSMRGRYHEATFQERRNALDVLGVKVYIHPAPKDDIDVPVIETDQEWISVPEASNLTGIGQRTLYSHIAAGKLKTRTSSANRRGVHRDELARYLKARGSSLDLDAYAIEWFSVNKIVTLGLVNFRTIKRAIERGEVASQKVVVPHHQIHRDELNRFLAENRVRPKSTLEDIRRRVEITYTPIFTGVQSSFG
jgi:site-specific DNA recombinase